MDGCVINQLDCLITGYCKCVIGHYKYPISHNSPGMMILLSFVVLSALSACISCTRANIPTEPVAFPLEVWERILVERSDISWSFASMRTPKQSPINPDTFSQFFKNDRFALMQWALHEGNKDPLVLDYIHNGTHDDKVKRMISFLSACSSVGTNYKRIEFEPTDLQKNIFASLLFSVGSFSLLGDNGKWKGRFKALVRTHFPRWYTECDRLAKDFNAGKLVFKDLFSKPTLTVSWLVDHLGCLEDSPNAKRSFKDCLADVECRSIMIGYYVRVLQERGDTSRLEKIFSSHLTKEQFECLPKRVLKRIQDEPMTDDNQLKRYHELYKLAQFELLTRNTVSVHLVMQNMTLTVPEVILSCDLVAVVNAAVGWPKPITYIPIQKGDNSGAFNISNDSVYEIELETGDLLIVV